MTKTDESMISRLAQMLKRGHVVAFLGCLLISYGVVGLYEVLDKHPQSIHMVAQTDRGSVALNYYEDNLNFFKPRIHNIDNETGRVGLEFPLMNYMAALCYELFGFHEGFYRGLMLMVITGGLLAAYALANRFLKSPLMAGILTLLWASSPIIHYYTPNFLPGMASLGLAMGAWWCFFRPSTALSATLGFFLLITLAGLVKITSGITIIAMLMLVSAKRLGPPGIRERLKAIPADKGTLTALLGSIICIAAWYEYSGYLKSFYESPYFLMDIKPVTSWTSFKAIGGNFLALWTDHIYSPGVWLLLAAASVFLLFRIRHIPLVLGAITLLLLLGSGGFSFLMFAQLEHHDYYLLPMMNLPFFLLLTATKVGQDVVPYQSLPSFVKTGLVVVLVGVLGLALSHSATIQDKRYTDSFQQFGINYQPYTTLESQLEHHGISRRAHIISMVDRWPNISLYLMNRKGFTMRASYSQSRILYRIYQKGDYIVANDTAFVDFPSIRHFLDTPLFKHQGLAVYPIELDEQDRKAFLDTTRKALQPVVDHFKAPETFQQNVQLSETYFGLSEKEALVDRAFDLYRWLLNDVVKSQLQNHYPDAITPKKSEIAISRFYHNHKAEVKQLREEDALSRLHLAVLQADVPLLFRNYHP